MLSPGNDGDVSQSNTAKALGLAANGNETKQSIDQRQGGHSSAPSDARKPDEKSGYGSDEKSGYGAERARTHAGGRAGGVEPAGRRRRCDGRAGKPPTPPVDPRAGAPVTTATSRSRTTRSQTGRGERQRDEQSIDQRQGGIGPGDARKPEDEPATARMRSPATARTRARSTPRSLGRKRRTSRTPTRMRRRSR